MIRIMEYRNNQYIKLNIAIEEISKIRVLMDGKNKLIEDLEIGIEEPNIIICYGGKEMRYENIYYSVRIVITDYMTLYERWREIPEFIEYIIVYGKIYKNNRDKFNFIEYNDAMRQEIILREMIEEERINEINDEGNTVLMILCRKNKKEEIKKIIEKMDKKMIDNANNDKKTALHIACEEKNMDIVEILIKYMSMRGINKSDKEDNTGLIILCMIQQEEMAIKVMMKMSKEGINKYNKCGESALYWSCEHYMDIITNNLIRNMDEEVINKRVRNGESILSLLCKKRNEKYIIKILPKMKIYEEKYKLMIGEIIRRKKNMEGKNIIMEYAEKNREEECLRMIRYVNKEIIEMKDKKGRDIGYWIEQNDMSVLREKIKIDFYN